MDLVVIKTVPTAITVVRDLAEITVTMVVTQVEEIEDGKDLTDCMIHIPNIKMGAVISLFHEQEVIITQRKKIPILIQKTTEEKVLR